MKEVDIDKVAESLSSLFPTIGLKLIRPVELQVKQAISPLVLHTLTILSQKDAFTMTELANEMRMVKQQMTPIIDKLVKSDFVYREYDENDRRTVKIRISKTGLQFYDDFKKDLVCTMKKRLEVLDSNDLFTLHNSLSDLYRVLSKLS